MVKLFPILSVRHKGISEDVLRETPSKIPWCLVEPHATAIQKNHDGQSLEALASRGGLSPLEVFAGIHGFTPYEKPEYTEETSASWLTSMMYPLEHRKNHCACDFCTTYQ